MAATGTADTASNLLAGFGKFESLALEGALRPPTWVEPASDQLAGHSLKIEFTRGWTAWVEAWIVRRDFGAFGCRVPGESRSGVGAGLEDVFFAAGILVAVGNGGRGSFENFLKKAIDGRFGRSYMASHRRGGSGCSRLRL